MGAEVAGAADRAATTTPWGALRCIHHHAPAAAITATTATTPATHTGTASARDATGAPPGTGTAGAWIPGTPPRPRSASARRSASRM